MLRHRAVIDANAMSFLQQRHGLSDVRGSGKFLRLFKDATCFLQTSICIGCIKRWRTIEVSVPNTAAAAIQATIWLGRHVPPVTGLPRPGIRGAYPGKPHHHLIQIKTCWQL